MSNQPICPPTTPVADTGLAIGDGYRAGANGGRPAVLEVHEVTKTYGSEPPVPALRGASLTVAQGELVGIVGPSGSGKTTLLHIIGTLDQAPVTVEITTAAVKHALIVPIDALLALSGGDYAVETINGQGVHQLVAVTLGAFDDADGTVQVTGALRARERIVVPNL